MRRYTRQAKQDLPYDRHDVLNDGTDGPVDLYRHHTLLTEALANGRLGTKCDCAYDRALYVFKELRSQLEAIPVEPPARKEHDHNSDVHITKLNTPAPPVSLTKGRKRSSTEPKPVGAPGKKKKTRFCSNCGLKQGHNRSTCPNPPSTIGVGGRGHGRGRGRGRPSGTRAIRRQLLCDTNEEEEDVEVEEDVEEEMNDGATNDDGDSQ